MVVPPKNEPAGVLAADVPWMLSDKLGARGAEANYACMPLIEICRYPLPRLLPDCYLFFWRLASMPREALDVIGCWGFKPKAEIVWVKTQAGCGACGGQGYTKEGEPPDTVPLWCATCSGRGTKLHFGLGHHVRAAHEVCIIATRGNPKPLVRTVRSVFEAPVREHSAKPDAFYALVEQFAPGPYVELFSRRTRPGWLTLGNEAGKLDGSAPQ